MSRPANMPRPNTNFLSRIIRSTESHNASLLAAEAAESQARLEKVEERQKRRIGAPSDIRRRQMGDIKAILGGASSSRARSSRSVEGSSKREDKDRPRDGRSASPRRERHRHRDRSSEREKTCRASKRESQNDHGSRSPRHEEERRRRRPRSRSRERGETSRRSHKERHHRNRRNRSVEGDQDGDMTRSSQSRSDRAKGRPGSKAELQSDSDPLDDLIGPAPPPQVRVRGRGFQGAQSGIDRRFAADYDPKVDMEPEGAPDDWDDAVETFRDRKKWEQSQEQRMRAAGFGEEEIAKWKKGGQQNEEDVRWAKAGEKREWDRGKEDEPRGLFSFDG